MLSPLFGGVFMTETYLYPKLHRHDCGTRVRGQGVKSAAVRWKLWFPSCVTWEARLLTTLQSFLFLVIYLFLTVLGLCCHRGFSLVVASTGHSLVVVSGLLIVVASSVAEHGLWSTRASVVGGGEL